MYLSLCKKARYKMIHQLKIESEYFKQIATGVKTYEVRKNDRGFCVGDYLGLNEITDHPCNEKGERKETGDFILVRVLSILSNTEYVKEGYVIMAIKPCTIQEIALDKAPIYNDYLVVPKSEV